MFNPILEQFQSADDFSITSEDALRHPNVVWEAIDLVLFVKLVAGRLGKPNQMVKWLSLSSAPEFRKMKDGWIWFSILDVSMLKDMPSLVADSYQNVACRDVDAHSDATLRDDGLDSRYS